AAGSIEGGDLAPAPGIVGAFLQLGHNTLDDAVLYLLVIGRDITLPARPHGIVEVELADLQGVLAQRERHFLYDALGADHALRAAKTTKSRVRHGIGVERRRFRVDMR